jgi:ATP-dependent RNA helicase RhlE
LDLVQQGHLQLGTVSTLVLDEVDRMLDMGFLPDLRRIVRLLPSPRQSLFFSATLPSEILELTRGLLVDPVHVRATPAAPSVPAIEQRVVYVEQDGKANLLRRVVAGDGADRVLVFTRTKRRANQLATRLERWGIRAAAIHGNKSQGARNRALDGFRGKSIDVLVATDVAARGIDVAGISHVVNFDLPGDPDSYLHRIGRTGRAGSSGVAITFCTQAEKRELRAIEKGIRTQLISGANGDGSRPEGRPYDAASERADGASDDAQNTKRPHRSGALPRATRRVHPSSLIASPVGTRSARPKRKPQRGYSKSRGMSNR